MLVRRAVLPAELATSQAAQDTVTGAALAQEVSDLASVGVVSKGDALIGVKRALTGAVATNQHDWNERAQLSIYDFFTSTQIADAKTGTPVLDTTTAVQAAITAATANGLELQFEGVVLCGVLSSTAADIRWRGKPGAKILQTPATYGAVNWITLTGDRAVLSDLVIDGNQFAMTNGQGCSSSGLCVNGKSPSLTRVTVRGNVNVGFLSASNNAPALTGSTAYGPKRGSFVDCHFDDNGGLGGQTNAMAYHTFVACTFDRNGYGARKTRANYADTSHGFAAFGLALRFRSNHIDFVACHARDNGRDGLDVNQGSYAIRFVDCICSGNDDGGFTVASDNTGSGLPGEGEACYDLEFIGCEGSNNYTSGLALYSAAHNITVSGGRYFNNNRVAGNLAVASSYINGVYCAAGCTGLNIDTKAYDERQYRSITGVAGSGSTRTLTAAGWVPGAMLYYPKVAIYSGSDGSFQGYGSITAEAAGSVTIQTTANNGVVLASIGAGMYVTQAVQHTGVFADNNCQGQVHVDGFGHRIGPVAYSGRNVMAGYNASNQNIVLPKARPSQTELLSNPSFDAGITGWAFASPAGGSATAYTGATKRSAGALQLVGGTSSVNYADAALIASAQAFVLGEFVEFGAWCFASSQGDAQITLYVNSAGLSHTVAHPGGGWKYLRLGIQVSPTDTGIGPARLTVAAGKTVFYDSASLRSIDSPIDGRELSPASRSLAF